MKNRLLLLACLLLAAAVRAQDNVVVSPEDTGKVFAHVRTSVAFDGRIYLARLAALKTDSTVFNMCEVLRSDDGGFEWQRIVLDSLPGNESFHAVDICAAGADSAVDQLFLATSTVLNGATAVQSIIRLRTLNPNTGYILDTLRQQSMAAGTDHRGYEAIALASDWRQPAQASDPYSLSMAFTKATAAGVDSVIIYTDNDGGALLFRRSIYGTTKKIRSLSAAVGTININYWPLLGVTWDEFADTAAEYGDMKVALLDADNGDFTGSDGIYTSTAVTPDGDHPDVARRPTIAISQTYIPQDTGIGGQDYRIMMSWESKSRGNTINYRSVDSFINTTPQFDYYYTDPEPFEDTLSSLYPHLAYDPAGKRFFLTWYDALTQEMPLKYQALNTLPLSFLTTVTDNYRDATTPIAGEAMPRIAVGNTTGMAYCAWNGRDSTFFMPVEISTSVRDALTSRAIQVNAFPNPTQGIATLAFRAERPGLARVEVVDVQGRVVLATEQSATTGDNRLSVDLSALPAGAYLARLSGAVTGYAKVVVSH